MTIKDIRDWAHGPKNQKETSDQDAMINTKNVRNSPVKVARFSY
jgi:hypothetical protein